LRYRKNATGYFGKPDVVLKKRKTVVFVDSCFWHGCPKHCRLPSTNKAYWREKIERNKRRDREVARHYKRTGWRCVRVWEHDLLKKGFKEAVATIKAKVK
jgi:DNA mismatch endonuclease (patch repair protein)